MTSETKMRENDVSVLKKGTLEQRIALLKNKLDKDKIFFAPSNPFLSNSPLYAQKIYFSSPVKNVAHLIMLLVPEATLSVSLSQITITPSEKVPPEILCKLRDTPPAAAEGPTDALIKDFFCKAVPTLKLIDISDDMDSPLTKFKDERATFMSRDFPKKEVERLIKEIPPLLPEGIFETSTLPGSAPDTQSIIIEFKVGDKGGNTTDAPSSIRDSFSRSFAATGKFAEKSKSFANELKERNFKFIFLSFTALPSSIFSHPREIINGQLSKKQALVYQGLIKMYFKTEIDEDIFSVSMEKEKEGPDSYRVTLKCPQSEGDIICADQLPLTKEEKFKPSSEKASISTESELLSSTSISTSKSTTSTPVPLKSLEKSEHSSSARSTSTSSPAFFAPQTEPREQEIAFLKCFQDLCTYLKENKIELGNDLHRSPLAMSKAKVEGKKVVLVTKGAPIADTEVKAQIIAEKINSYFPTGQVLAVPTKCSNQKRNPGKYKINIIANDEIAESYLLKLVKDPPTTPKKNPVPAK